MNNIQFIVTGGTLACSRNGEGKQVPDGKALDALLAELGFPAALKPYIIDSIDLNISEHHPQLFKAVKETLDRGDTPVVCGGTDSLIWYSTLLTKDLMRHGYLQEGSGQKVIFISSMKSIEEGPELVKGLLKTGKLVAEQKELHGKAMNGGFALSADDTSGTNFVLHNVTNHFDKISSKLINALRSNCPVEYILNGHITPTEPYEAPATLAPNTHQGYARIAPPLLGGHDSEAMLAYLRRIGTAQAPYDGVVIEGMPTHLHKHDKAAIPLMVKQLTDAGTRVVFVNPMRYDENSGRMLPVIDQKEWEREGGFTEALKKAGAKFTTGLPKDVYIDMMLGTDTGNAKQADVSGFARPLRNQKVIGVRYVPDAELMCTAVDDVAPGAKNMVFSALPGSVMPNAVIPCLERHKADTKYWSTFEYNGNQYIDSHNGDFVEQPFNDYAAGQETGKLVTPYPFTNAVQAIYHGRHARVAISPNAANARG